MWLCCVPIFSCPGSVLYHPAERSSPNFQICPKSPQTTSLGQPLGQEVPTTVVESILERTQAGCEHRLWAIWVPHSSAKVRRWCVGPERTIPEGPRMPNLTWTEAAGGKPECGPCVHSSTGRVSTRLGRRLELCSTQTRKAVYFIFVQFCELANDFTSLGTNSFQFSP